MFNVECWMFLFLFVAPLHFIRAVTIVLTPVADTTLIENSPTNNMGGTNYFNAGSNMHGERNRAVLRFDLAGAIPAGSKIKTVTNLFTVMQSPADMPASSIFDLHRLLTPWGEGDKTTSGMGAGRGAPATTNEATWLDRFAFANAPWTSPGAAATNDFMAASSAEQFIVDAGSSPYNFTSGQLVADVQFWLDNPPANFGWLLKTRDETTPSTARRFASREDTNNAPQLVIEFIAPPQINGAQISGNQMRFNFLEEAGQSYTVQFRDSFSPANAWATLTNISAPSADTNAMVFDGLGGSKRFYRVFAP